MLDPKLLLTLAIAGMILPASNVKCFAAEATTAPSHAEAVEGKHHENSMKWADEKDGDKDGDKEDEHDEHYKKEGKKEKEIEQAVPMAFVPQAVLDAVKKEVPGGTITEAELEAKKHQIMYSFDVTAGDMKYDVKITVDGKFYSKHVDDEADEKDAKDEKEEAGEKK